LEGYGGDEGDAVGIHASMVAEMRECCR
jgi:hypothetical protein